MVKNTNYHQAHFQKQLFLFQKLSLLFLHRHFSTYIGIQSRHKKLLDCQ